MASNPNEAPQRNHVEPISETSHHGSEKMGHLSTDFHFLLVKIIPMGINSFNFWGEYVLLEQDALILKIM